MTSWNTETPFRIDSHVRRTILYAAKSQKKSMSNGAPTPRCTCHVDLFFSFLGGELFISESHFAFFKNYSNTSWRLPDRIWLKIESFLASCLCKCSSLFTISIKNEKKIHFVFSHLFNQKILEKASRHYHEDVLSYFEWKKKISFFVIFDDFSPFSIVHVTVDLDPQIFWGHFETTILHHFCRTSR